MNDDRLRVYGVRSVFSINKIFCKHNIIYLTEKGNEHIILMLIRGVAQLVARMVRDHKVVGSNPVASTKTAAGLSSCGCFDKAKSKTVSYCPGAIRAKYKGFRKRFAKRFCGKRSGNEAKFAVLFAKLL